MANNRVVAAGFILLNFIMPHDLFPYGLKGFIQDFTGKTVEITDDMHDQRQQETNTTPLNSQPVVIAQSAPADGSGEGKLNRFYNDFNPPSNESSNSNIDSSSNQNTLWHYYHDYPMDYYRYHFPYYYPYSAYYPSSPAIIPVSETAIRRDIAGDPRETAPERHNWFSASMSYQNISSELNAFGMTADMVSSGKETGLSYGFKAGYILFTEDEGEDHYSLALLNIGLILGKQMWRGPLETFISYCSLGDLSGASLKLSTDQWIHKYIFLSCGAGLSIINESPLTDLYAGAGAGNSLLRFSMGYRSQSSRHYELNGPEARVSVVF